jgi:hypothetical protein
METEMELLRKLFPSTKNTEASQMTKEVIVQITDLLIGACLHGHESLVVTTRLTIIGRGITGACMARPLLCLFSHTFRNDHPD